MSHLEAWFIIEDNTRWTNLREEGLFLGWLLTTEQATIGYEVLKTLHKAYKVKGDGNLPYWQSTTEREIERVRWMCWPGVCSLVNKGDCWASVEVYAVLSVLLFITLITTVNYQMLSVSKLLMFEYWQSRLWWLHCVMNESVYRQLIADKVSIGLPRGKLFYCKRTNNEWVKATCTSEIRGSLMWLKTRKTRW